MGTAERGKTAYMFTGQGSQRQGMFWDLAGYPKAGEIFLTTEKIVGCDLFADPLSDTSKAQPSLMEPAKNKFVEILESVEYVLKMGVDTFIEFGPKPVLKGLLRQISREAKGIFIIDSLLKNKLD